MTGHVQPCVSVSFCWQLVLVCKTSFGDLVVGVGRVIKYALTGPTEVAEASTNTDPLRRSRR